VTLFCAAYDALDLYADGPNLNSRSWFDLGFSTRVVLGDCLFVANRLVTSGGATRSLSTQKLKEACDRMVKFQNKCVTVNDIMPPKANRAGFLRYQKRKKEKEKKEKKENHSLSTCGTRGFLIRYQKVMLSRQATDLPLTRMFSLTRVCFLIRYQKVMLSRQANNVLGAPDKATLDLDKWLDMVLDTILIFLEEQEAALIAIFSTFDVDGDGHLSLQEFIALITSISPPATNAAELGKLTKNTSSVVVVVYYCSI
jgi:hypothetical protein